ncbi:hypothetical protein IFM89_014843 [Coptis chinensis]|uniref:Uncharacterized protein n=1 Tax=Coptis chinensis TaxID=261450 RepID=A0A835ICJ1_9MAGN|nr:hypothetical protein IFM89_014843 [Coptis chinensis]
MKPYRMRGKKGTTLVMHQEVATWTSNLLISYYFTGCRKSGDQTKAISYINAFSKSRLPSTMVKWATTQIGMDKEASKPNASTPQALLIFLLTARYMLIYSTEWLLNFEQRGAEIFNNNALRLHAKSVFDESKADFEQRLLQPYNKVEDDLLFDIDNKKEEEEEKKDDQEMLESINDAFTTAAHMMKFTANDERRKRKENRKSGDIEMRN